MKKRIVSIVAIIALVAVLAACLVACNAESYQKKLEKAGYNVTVFEGDEADKESDGGDGLEWLVMGIDANGNSVSVMKFAKTEDAKEYEANFVPVQLGSYKRVCERQGKIVIAGSEKGVKDAK